MDRAAPPCSCRPPRRTVDTPFRSPSCSVYSGDLVYQTGVDTVYLEPIRAAASRLMRLGPGEVGFDVLDGGHRAIGEQVHGAVIAVPPVGGAPSGHHVVAEGFWREPGQD